jgi:hypothetical protein
MLKKITFTNGGGRFGNQLINYIHLVSCGLEFNNLSIEHRPLSEYLRPIKGNFIVCNGKIEMLKIVRNSEKSYFFKVLQRRMRGVSIRLHHLFGFLLPQYSSIIVGRDENNIGLLLGTKVNHIVCDHDFIDLLGDKTVIAGWGLRNWTITHKWKEVISDNLMKSFKVKNKNKEKTCLGVHIRGTDFKEHADGKLYFDDKKWIDAVELIYKTFNIDSVVFMSDEEKEWDKFIRSNKNYYISKGSASECGDMYNAFSDLLCCDYILTSGSTFALMAAWISNANVIDLPSVRKGENVKAMEYPEWLECDNFLVNWK